MFRIAILTQIILLMLIGPTPCCCLLGKLLEAPKLLLAVNDSSGSSVGCCGCHGTTTDSTKRSQKPSKKKCECGKHLAACTISQKATTHEMGSSCCEFMNPAWSQCMQVGNGISDSARLNPDFLGWTIANARAHCALNCRWQC